MLGVLLNYCHSPRIKLVCFFLSDERKEMEKLIIQNGGKYSAELTKKCTHLVCDISYMWFPRVKQFHFCIEYNTTCAFWCFFFMFSQVQIFLSTTCWYNFNISASLRLHVSSLPYKYFDTCSHLLNLYNLCLPAEPYASFSTVQFTKKQI